MTQLAYISTPEATEAEVEVLSVGEEAGAVSVILDSTPFYPQGGGQPSDTGVITGPGFEFVVRKAVLIDGTVHHLGQFVEGSSAHGPGRACVDLERRRLHARLHTAGHLVMTAIYELREMRAIKGFHFPEGPYVEFEEAVPEDERPALMDALQARLDEMVDADAEVIVESTTPAQLIAEGVYMPAELPRDKPTRVVTTFGYRSPCGGTHVERSGELRGLRARAIKAKSGHTRIPYELSHE